MNNFQRIEEQRKKFAKQVEEEPKPEEEKVDVHSPSPCWLNYSDNLAIIKVFSIKVNL